MEKLQFIYTLKLVDRLIDDGKWTEQDNFIIEEHFHALQQLLSEGKLILAGRTMERDPSGYVILETDSEEEAVQIMKQDPAVRDGIMTAKIAPYRVALMRC